MPRPKRKSNLRWKRAGGWFNPFSILQEWSDTENKWVNIQVVK